MLVKIRFESHDRDYVAVLSDPHVATTGKLASQDAGSSNPGIYYQVGGGGVNGLFADALGANETKIVNTALVAAYDAKYGAGSWPRDSGGGANSPLTSFFVPVDPANSTKVGGRVAGIVYSVGPVLGRQGITDKAQYRSIYTDGFTAVADANAAGAGVTAVRITMLSTGIYAQHVDDRTLLFDTSAALILDAVDAAAAASAAADFPDTVLVNARIDANGKGKEVDAFTNAARARGVPVTGAGFDLTVKTAS